MDLSPDFKDLLEELGRAGVEYVVVGGYAVAFHGRPRATKDIDLMLAGTDENLSRAAAALASFGAPASIADAVRSMKESDVVYLGRPPMRVDFLRQIDGVATERVFARAQEAVLDGITVRVIALDDLIENKRAVARPQDLEDCRFLERVRARRG